MALPPGHGKRTLVIVNPAAGGGRAARRAEPLVTSLRNQGGVVTCIETSGPGDATRLAREADADVVVAAGGDGTLHEVVNGLASRAAAPALAVLPVGTGNSFARDFGLHIPESAVAALVRGQARPVDLLRIDHALGPTWSINLVGFGFSATAGSLMNRRFKALGVAGYVAAVLGTLARLQTPVISAAINGRPADARPVVLLCLCNSRCTGGTMQMAPAADPSDGKLDVIRVGPMSRLRFLSAFPRIFRGTHVQMPEVEATTAERVDFFLEQPVDVMVDGEVYSLLVRTVTVVPAALSMIA